jgi:hypothetical protein
MRENETPHTYNTKVCVVGLGPAGIGASLKFLDSNLATDVIYIDAGNPSSNRSCSILQDRACRKEEPCQIISGVGGCSLFGGKISAFPAGGGIIDVFGSIELAQRRLSQAFSLFNTFLSLQEPNITQSECKNAEEIFGKLGFRYKYYNAYLYNQEELRKMYQEISLQLNSAGTLLLNTKLIQVKLKEGVFELLAVHERQEITIFTKYLLLGIGRLGRSFLKFLNHNLNLDGKANHLDVGIRLEFPTDLYPDIDKYHNDLKLLFNKARTFCVCKDGKIAPYLFEGVFLTEGYFNPMYKSGFTNVGILIRLEASPQNELTFNEIKKRALQINGGKHGVQRLPDYLGICSRTNNSFKTFGSSISFWTQTDINQYFPQTLSAKIKEAVRYFVSRFLPKDRWDEVLVFGPQVDYWGLSFPVNPDFSIIPRMYLIGDCTGRFRGILQALCSGIVASESVIGGENEKNL